MGEYADKLQTRLRKGNAPEASAPRPNPLKGVRDGVCNRTACQMPLDGFEQWTMRDHETFTDARRLHYCARCAKDFNRYDASMGVELRCTLIPETEGLRGGF